MSSRMRALLLGVFFLSGAASLVYEIAWVRRLALVFGSTTLAASTALAALMGGLALGAYAVGRYADRHADRALRVYGALEIGVALFAAATPAVFRALASLYLPLAPRLENSPQAFFLVQFLLAGAALLVPAVLMGGTLPLLARAVVASEEDLAGRIGALYAVNTLGAALGAAAANYGLLPFAGLRASELAAAAASAAAGLAALAIGRRAQAEVPPAAEAEPSEGQEPGAPLPPPAFSPASRALLAGAALSGFAAMACEVAWSRALALVLGSSVYSFGLVVLVFLIGLGIGGAAFERLSRRGTSPVTVFAGAEAAAAVAIAGAIMLLPRLPALFLHGFPAARASFPMLQAWDFALASLVLLPCAVLFGAAFPAAVAATSPPVGRVGLGVGRVFSANTAGTVAGAFAAGFLLVPRVGLKTTLAAAAAACALAGVAAFRHVPIPGLRRPLAAAALVGFLAALLVPRWPTNVLTMGVSFYAASWPSADTFLAVARTREVLFYKDGVHTTLAVTKSGTNRFYSSNGKTDASNDRGDMANQIYLGQLPMLLHPNPQEVFVLGLGTGVSASAVARYPGVRSIEIVDIEPAAREAAGFFREENRDVLSDPRVHLVAGDGRNRLMAVHATYDVIISDPSDVWVAGVGNLFTQEFYEIARRRLKKGGLMVQWLHSYSLPPEDLRLIVATFRFVFPYASLWRPNRGDLVLLGSADRVLWDWPQLVERFQKTPGVSQDLRSIGLWDPLAVFAAFVCDGEELGAFVRGVTRTHRDDRPVIEYFTPRAAYEDTLTANERALTEAQGHFLPFLKGFDEKKDLDAQAAYLLGFGHASLGRTASAIRIMEEAARAAPGNARYLVGLGNQYRVAGNESRAVGAYRRALEISPGEAEAARNLASILRGQGDEAEADRVLRACLQVSPGDAGVLEDFARLQLDLGRPADALPPLEKALAADPDGGVPQLLYGRALEAAGRAADAVPYLRRARTALFDDPSAQRTLGEALLGAGDLEEAALAFGRAAVLDPLSVEAYIGLARAAQRRGDIAGEQDAIRRAREIDPTNPLLAGR
jgi:spermidine synthase